MGKIRNKKPKSKPTKSTDNTEVDVPSSSFLDPSPFAHLLPKDSDLTSVKSLNSMKNKFGIKKSITKNEKLKLRKEMLKQKIDYVKEIADSNKKASKSKTKKKNTKQEIEKSNPILSDKPDASSINTATKKVHTKVLQDKDEIYVKLGNKPKKGIEKRRERQKEYLKELQYLKSMIKKY